DGVSAGTQILRARPYEHLSARQQSYDCLRRAAICGISSGGHTVTDHRIAFGDRARCGATLRPTKALRCLGVTVTKMLVCPWAIVAWILLRIIHQAKLHRIHLELLGKLIHGNL